MEVGSGDTPGPGAYNVPERGPGKIAYVPPERRRPSSAFATRTKRSGGYQANKEGTPGPGSYESKRPQSARRTLGGDSAFRNRAEARVGLAEVAQHRVELGVHRLEHARRRDALAVLHAQHRVQLRARVVRADEREHVLDLQDRAVVQGRAVGIVVLQRAQPLHAPRRAGEAVVDEALPQKVLDEVEEEGAALDLCFVVGVW